MPGGGAEMVASWSCEYWWPRFRARAVSFLRYVWWVDDAELPVAAVRKCWLSLFSVCAYVMRRVRLAAQELRERNPIDSEQ